MVYTMKSYPVDLGYHDTFFEVVQFLNRLNDKHQFLHFHWSRFEWMFARQGLDLEQVKRIRLFYNENQTLSGILTIEDDPKVWYPVYEDDVSLKKMIIDYFMENHQEDAIMVPQDRDMIALLQKYHFAATDFKDPISIYTQDTVQPHDVIDYDIQSLEEDYQLDQIHSCLWKGFNHGDQITYLESELENRRHMTSSPHFNKGYTYVAIKDHAYVSYAGIWYIKGSKTALIEPVATVPEHRQKGLSKACIYEAMIQAMKDGAKDIFVGSNQPFYDKIGFKLYQEAVCYRKK